MLKQRSIPQLLFAAMLVASAPVCANDLADCQRQLAILTGALPVTGDIRIIDRSLSPRRNQHELALRFLESEVATLGLQSQRQAFFVDTPVYLAVRLVNLIVRLPGSLPESQRRKIVIGAHYDTVNSEHFTWMGPIAAHGKIIPTPGADDNGSGVVGVLHLIKQLSSQAQTMPFLHDIEFVFFDGEEGGGEISTGLAEGARGYVRSQDDGERQRTSLAIIFDMIGYPSRLAATSRLAIGVSAYQISREKLCQHFRAENPVLPLIRTASNRHRDRHFIDITDTKPFNFARIPSVLFCDVLELDQIHNHYHRPSDSLEIIDWSYFDGATEHAKALVQHAARSLENDLSPPKEE